MANLSQNLPFKLPLDQVPDDPKLNRLHFSIQNLAYHTAKYAGTYLEQPANYSQLGTENINTNSRRFYAQAGGVINPKDLIYFTNSGGTTVKAVQARANAIGTVAKGVYLGAVALAANDWAEFILSPTILTTTGLTPGITYYLSTATAGLFQSTRPTVAGQIIQDIGFALSDKLLLLNPWTPVILL